MFIEYYEKLIPPLFKEAFLEDFQESHPLLLVFAKNWIKKPTPLFVHGEYGVGKTHFTYALVRELITKHPNLWPEFYSSPNLDGSLLEAVKSDLGDRHLIKKVCEADVLIIDDIGREMKTDRFKRQFFEIVDYRYSHCKLTIMTSNYSIDKLHELFEGATFSRIQGWNFIEITGVDRRK